jgi:hypothetical protein
MALVRSVLVMETRAVLSLAFGVLALATLAACKEERSSDRSVAAPALSAPETGRAESGGAPGEPLALPDAVRDVRGVVVRAGRDEVVVRPQEGETVALRLAPDVPVTVNGEAAEATDIREGEPVQAAYTFEDGEARAVRIEVGPAAR